MPLAAVYTASKMAIEGFTGSLAHELQAFNVRLKLVEPGYAPTTRFSQNTELRIEDLIPQAYAAFAEPIFAEFARPVVVTKEFDVAEAVWQAANDMSGTTASFGGSGRCRFLRPSPADSRWRRSLDGTVVQRQPLTRVSSADAVGAAELSLNIHVIHLLDQRFAFLLSMIGSNVHF